MEHRTAERDASRTPPTPRRVAALPRDLVLLGLALLVPLVLGEQVVAGGPVVRFDRAVETFLVPHRANAGVRLARHVTDLGRPAAVVPLLVVLALIVAARRRDAWLPVRVAALLVALGLAVVVLKDAVGRPAPHGGTVHGGAWPSGHTTTATVVWGAAVRVLGLRGRVALALGVGVPLVVGPCLVLAGFHQVSDVLAGWALGAALLLLSDRAAGGWPRSRPSATTH